MAARAMGVRLGAVSPAELVAKRLASRAGGWSLFAAFTLVTVPNMVTGLHGCGLALERWSEDVLSARTGALGVAVSVPPPRGHVALAFEGADQ